MKVGTKSVLFGVHCFALHPFFVAYSWIKLYGFTFDPRVCVAFFVHDLGYFGKPNMDGKEGETHVDFGAKIMGFLFDTYPNTLKFYIWKINLFLYIYKVRLGLFMKLTPKSRLPKYSTKWSDFSMYHSRYYAKKNNAQFSKLCVADKLSFCYTPKFLYFKMATATGELVEYMRNYFKDMPEEWIPTVSQKIEWRNYVCDYLKEWVVEHKDCKIDTWTQTDSKNIADESNSRN